MASTILRFKNPNIYQIIDQRVYRILYGQEMKVSTKVDAQVPLYLQYLHDLRKACVALGISFTDADRIFYELDKDINGDIKINY